MIPDPKLVGSVSITRNTHMDVKVLGFEETGKSSIVLQIITP